MNDILENLLNRLLEVIPGYLNEEMLEYARSKNELGMIFLLLPSYVAVSVKQKNVDMKPLFDFIEEFIDYRGMSIDNCIQVIFLEGISVILYLDFNLDEEYKLDHQEKKILLSIIGEKTKDCLEQYIPCDLNL